MESCVADLTKLRASEEFSSVSINSYQSIRRSRRWSHQHRSVVDHVFAWPRILFSSYRHSRTAKPSERYAYFLSEFPVGLDLPGLAYRYDLVRDRDRQ